jgi:phage head maturation protease
MLEYKSIPFEIKEMISVEGGGWEISGYASTFGGEPDAYGDVIVKGAFAESHFCQASEVPLRALRADRQAARDPRGRQGPRSALVDRRHPGRHRRLQAGEGRRPGLAQHRLHDQGGADYRDDGVRLLRKVDLFEVSAVAIPANRNAVITDVKSGRAKPFDAHSDDVRVAVAEWMERIRSGSDLRTKEGRAISTARRTRMAAVSGSLRESADEIEAMLEETAPPKAIHIGLELRRRRLERHGITMGATQ